MPKLLNQTQIIVEVALSKLKGATILGSDALDTPSDIESANKAGVGVIALCCGGFDDS